MSITVKKHLAEKFIDWFPHNTKLYIRGERGKNWEQSNKLREELFKQLRDWFDSVVAEEVNHKLYNDKYYGFDEPGY